MYLPLGLQEKHVKSLLSTTDKNAAYTISADQLTWSGNSATFTCGRSTIPLRPSEKYYVEWTVVTVGTNLGIGFANASASTASYAGSDTNGVSYYAGGSWSYNGGGKTGTGLPSSLSAGNVLCMAYDGINHNVWLRLNNGSWIGSTAGDPVGGTNGFSCPITGKIYIAYGNGSGNASMTLNAGSTAFSFAVPAGYHSPNSTAQQGV